MSLTTQKLKKMKTQKNLAVVFSLLLLVPIVSALTANISNPRVVLYGDVVKGKTLQLQNDVVVNNDNNYDVLIKINESGDWENRVVLDEKEFTLKAGENRQVNYTINIDKEGTYNGDIIVTFTESSTKTDLSIAQELEVFAKSSTESKPSGSAPYLYFMAGAIVLLIIGIAILNYKKSGK
jgi:hypothetical protein